ncbi:MAG: hypothetical protein KF749_03785 [Bacteroidetes bacterium]|nr:hypothetical protein [Bacteroidota bacterium]MCW5897512.1 hypothetical protein [Bacteroidota bacterium]
MKFLSLVGFVFVVSIAGCAASRETPQLPRGRVSDAAVVAASSTTEFSDTVRTGPTNAGERESVEKQKRVIVFVAVIVALLTIITLGAIGRGG